MSHSKPRFSAIRHQHGSGPQVMSPQLGQITGSPQSMQEPAAYRDLSPGAPLREGFQSLTSINPRQ